MGVDHRGTQVTSPPEFGVGETLMQIVPSDFDMYVQKGAFCDLQNTPKSVFDRTLCPGPRWGSLWRSPRPSSLLGRGHPYSYPTPLGTDPLSSLAMRPPEVQPDLRLWVACRPMYDY